MIFAIPGNIDISTSVGTNKLIQEGAKIAINPIDILSEYKLNQDLNIEKNIDINKKIKENLNSNIKIPKEYQSVYNLISNSPIHINEISKKLNIKINEINSIITMLEIEEYIKQVEPNEYIRI